MIKKIVSGANHYKATDGWVMCEHCGTIWRSVLRECHSDYVCPHCYHRSASMVPSDYFYCAGQFTE